MKILRNVGINKWFPAEHIFPEEDQKFSATLRAVRYATRLVSESGASNGAHADTGTAPDKGEDEVYYLV